MTAGLETVGAGVNDDLTPTSEPAETRWIGPPAFVAPDRPTVLAAVRPSTQPLPGPEPAGLRRPRLTDHCLAAHATGSLVLTGPPGAGKTEAAAQLAERLRERGERVGWLRGSVLLDDIADAMLGEDRDHVRSLHHLVLQLQRVGGTLVVDDAHLVEGPGIARVVDALARHLRFVFVGRYDDARWSAPLRVSGQVSTVGVDQLRFTSEEVRRLFAEHYGEPLAPREVRDLTQRTQGWPVALRLYRLATAGREPADRARAAAGLAITEPTRGYFATTILADLDAATLEVLRTGSMMRTATASWCDALLGRTDSGRALARAADGGLLVERHEDGYRYHPLLREYLRADLRATLGDARVRELYGKLARLHESAGWDDAALDAYLRARDVRGAARKATELSTVQPSADRGLDLLARARLAAVNGRLGVAVDDYTEAATMLADADLRADCLRERAVTVAWSGAPAATGRDQAHWLMQLRRALSHRPAALAGHPLAGSSGEWSLVSALAAVLDGNPEQARRSLATAAEGDSIGALVAGAVDAVLANWAEPAAIAAALEEPALRAEDGQLDGLAAMIRALAAVSGDAEHIELAERIGQECRDAGESWRELLACATAAIGRCRAGLSPAAALSRWEELADQLDAAVPRAWALWLSAAVSRTPELAARAAAAARACGMPALARTTPDWLGSPRATEPEPEPQPVVVGKPAVGIRCFGRFDLTVGGSPIAWHELRPRVQSVLRMLALHADKGVHVETLYEHFWPDSPVDSARRSLHVAVSMIRRVLAPAVGPGEPSLLERRGDMYVLRPPEGATVDVARFASLARQWRTARDSVALPDRVRLLREAFDLYTGGLLPEEGAADWIQAERARFQDMWLDIACSLAGTELTRGHAAAATDVCLRALDVDRYHDPAWRLLIRAHLAANDVGAAQRARSQYRAVLSELGIADVPAPPEPPRPPQLPARR